MKKFAMFAASLTLCALFSAGLPMQAAAATDASYQYAREGDVGRTALTASDILSAYLGEDVGEAEKNYLSSHDDFLLTYSPAVPSSAVHTFFEGNTLTVTAEPFSYVAINRNPVVWTPLTVNGTPMSEGEGTYTWTQEVGEEDGDLARVTYGTSFTVSADDIASFINLAYGAAVEASEKLGEERARYESALAAYRSAEEAYQNYLAAMETYREQRKTYDEYLAKLAAWTRKNAEYEAYQKANERYESDKAAYDNYEETYAQYLKDLQRYEEYLAAVKEYEQRMKDFEAQTSSKEAQTVLYQLKLLAYISKPATSLKRTLSSAILGNSVTQVLANREALILAGAEAKVVDLAMSSTINLRRLLNQLQLCKTDEARYVYYIGAYDALRQNFADLFRCLDYFYHGFQVVRGKIRDYDRTEQFEIMLAQLYYLCNALDDSGPVQKYKKSEGYFDANYKIGGSTKRTPAAILGTDGTFEDRDSAAPLPNGYAGIPDLPTEPEHVDEPTYPVRPTQPVPPEPVSPPEKQPAAVEEPAEPKAVPPAGDEPKAYEPTAEESALVAALGTELTLREIPEEPFTLTVQATSDKYFRNAQLVDIYFHKRAGEDHVYLVEGAEIGSYVEYPASIVPTRTRVGYTCVFDGWASVDDPDVLVDLNRLQAPAGSGELHLIPHYAETPNLYEVTWVVAGKTFKADCAYGTVPVYDEKKFAPLVKEDGTVRQYRFIGWNKNVAPMTERGARYEAQFEAGCVISWYVNGVGTQCSVWRGDLPSYDGIPAREADSVRRYVFAGWDTPVVPADGDKTYTARFNEEFLVSGNGVGSTVSFADGVYTADCSNTSARDFHVSGIFALAGEKSAGIAVRFAGGVFSFSPEAAFLAAESGISELSVYAVMTGASTFRYSVHLYGEEGEIFPEGCYADLAAAGDFDRDNVYLYELPLARAAEKTGVYFTIDEAGRINFRLRPGYTYELLPQYHVGVVGSENVTVTVSATLAARGETVSVTVGELPEGMHLESVYVRAADGTAVELNDDFTFVMPRSAVTVVALCEYDKYTVQFKSEGKVISTRTYSYGDTIEPPPTPFKAADEKYSYRFVGWDAELGTVTGDAEFNAVFEQTELPVENIPETNLNRIIRAVRIGAPIVLAVLVVLIVLLVVFLVLRKRKKRAALAAQKALQEVESTQEGGTMSEEEPSKEPEETAGETSEEGDETSEEASEEVSEEASEEELMRALAEEPLDEEIVRRLQAEREETDALYGALYPAVGGHGEGPAPAPEAYEAQAVPEAEYAEPAQPEPAPEGEPEEEPHDENTPPIAAPTDSAPEDTGAAIGPDSPADEGENAKNRQEG